LHGDEKKDKKRDMRHNKWVQNQFMLLKKHGANYRNVLLVTSLIETVVRDKASCTACKKREDFKKSLKSLGLVIDGNNEKESSYQKDCQHKKDCLKEINEVRVQRNELLHDIIRKGLPEKHIENTITKMAKNIEQICTKSNLFRNYFVTDSSYGFDPANLVK
jgi:hypothetical protein